MKTIYLLAWITNAIVITTLVTTKHPAMILIVLNVIVPALMLIIRQIMIHNVIDEDSELPF